VKIDRFPALGFAAMLAISACTGTASPSPAATSPSPAAASSATSPSPAASPSATPLAADPAEAVIKNIEPNAQITFWTYYLSPASM